MSASSSSQRTSSSDEELTNKDEPPSDEPWKRSFDEIRSQLYILVMFPFGEAIAWTTTFPYLYAMVKSLSSPSSDEDNIATYTGCIVGAFTLGEAIGAQFWSRVSDRLGRKPVLLMGNMGALTLALVFGCSTSLWSAIAVRFFAGFMNPNISTVNTMIGELIIKRDQARAFSTVHFLRIIATILGPALGGYLAEPTLKVPYLFPPGSIWDHYPFLLPNVLAALSLLTAALLGLFLLEETHPHLRYRPDISVRLWHGFKNRYHGRRWSSASSAGIYEAVNTEDTTETEMFSSPSTSKFTTQPPTSLKQEPPKVNRRLAFTPQVILQVISYALLGYLKVSVVALEPVYLGTPPSTVPSTPLHVIFGRAGGFGLSTTAQSNIMLTQAIAAIVAQWLFVTPIIDRWGAKRAYWLVLGTFAAVFAILPGCTSLEWGWAGWIVVPVFWAYGGVNTLGTTAQSVMMTNTCPSPAYLATINGAAVTAGSLTRTAGPAVTGAFYKLGLKIGYVGVAFWSMGVQCAIAFVISLWLKEH